MTKPGKLAALAVCGALLVSCTAKEEPGGGTETRKTEVLTNVFRGERVTLPEEYFLNNSVQPYYDAATGAMKVYCTHWHEGEEKDEEGHSVYRQDNLLLTIGADGVVADELLLDVGENVYVDQGVLTADRLYFLTSEYDETRGTQDYIVGILSLDDGTMTRSGSLNRFFAQTEDNWFYISQLAVDGDGFLYLASDSEIVVLDDTFGKSFSVTPSGWVNEMATAADGTVYYSGYMDDGYGLMPIDKSSKSLGAKVTLPASVYADQFLFGEEYDLYYTTDEGLFGYNFTAAEAEDGAPPEAELVFSYPNSDLFGNNVEVARVVDRDCVILYERDEETYNNYPAVYRRSADLDLSQIKVLEIAYTGSDWSLGSSIVRFNKQSDGVRLIARDYSQYNTAEDYQAGQKKLLNDVLNGLYKPDIVTGYSTSDTVIRKIYENGLYTDLYPLMAAGTKMSSGDLLGCVKRTFETKDGKLWAIGSSVQAQTLLGTREMLGDRTGWTLAEMIDFAESLPEGTQLLLGLSRETAAYHLLGSGGYGMFIDTAANTCNFECEDFLRYLEYLNRLPATYEEAMAATSVGDNYEERYLLYHSGQVALSEEYYYAVNDWVREETAFNTKDVVRIGYPTADGKTSGTTVDMVPYVITSFCEYPAEAWSFLESMIVPDESTESVRYGRDGFSVLKPQFMKVCEAEYDSLFEVYFSGGMSWGTYNPEYDDLNAEMHEPGIRKFFTEEDAAALLDWFDNDIGAPVSDAVSDEITQIVNEEITSYTGGAKTAEDCARVIQSRVSLWLAEHE
ncbi:MAG: hypothetical protein ACI4V1_07210 [Eubacteriales bacterium]